MSDRQVRNLNQDEAERRSELLTVESYDVALDLTTGDKEFRSVSTIVVESRGGRTFLEVRPRQLLSARLDGQPLDVSTFAEGRLPLDLSAGRHEVQVDAVIGYRNDGEGLHRSVDPADGEHYVYAMAFIDAAPSIFGCFDQPDLKATLTLQVHAPSGWVVIGNSPGEQVEPGEWRFALTPPLSTYFMTFIAGPYHVLRDGHDGIPLGLSARRSYAKHLDVDAAELFTATKQCFDEFHRLFGIRYPFGEYHQAFVPEFNAGAMENPGCVTFDDQLVFTSRVTRGARVQRAIVVAHEMAHQWFGNLTTPVWWDDLWLNESFAQYMAVRLAAEVTEFSDAWLHDSYETRQWGLTADQGPSTHPVGGNGARDASTALQDFDGISYVKGASILRQLNTAMGDEVFFRGLTDHFTRHRFGNAKMQDLVASWEGAGAGSLSTFVPNWLRAAGADTLTYDRVAGLVRRTPPADHPADRAHTFEVAVADRDREWATTVLTVQGTETPLVVNGEAVLLDPYDDTWAVTRPDEVTVQALKELLPRTTDPRLRAGVWNNVRSAFHNAAIDPADVLDLLAAGMPLEDSDDAVSYTMRWAIRSLPLCASDPAAALDRLHGIAMATLPQAPAGSTLQLARFQAAASSCQDAALLRSWLEGASRPEGITMDLALRWRILVRLAALGASDRGELAKHLAAERTARSQVEHVRALAAIPDDEAKASAWQCFTGEVDVPNHELEAAGDGMWQVGQESLTEQYVERFAADLPGTVGVRSGWMLAETARAFFPATSVRRSTVDRMAALTEREHLEPSLRRAVVDSTDDLRRLLAVRERYGKG